MKIPDRLKLVESQDIQDLDDPQTTLLHSQIIQKKPLLRRLYTDFYRRLKEAAGPTEGKKLVEIGSGPGFIKQVIPNVITSDILELPGLDRVFSASDMPFEDESIDGIVMFDVLHHLSRPADFFSEANRCLKTGGKIAMIEPANTLWGRFIYKNFHHESFDTEAVWTLPKSGPLSCSNSALAWIIFERDREKFVKEFPSLKIVRIKYHTPLGYLLSGGFTLRQLAPSFCYPIIKTVEYALVPFNNLLGMFETIELQKVR